MEYYVGWLSLTLAVSFLAWAILWSSSGKVLKVFAVVFALLAAPMVWQLTSLTDGQSVKCDFTLKRQILGMRIDHPTTIYLLLDGVKPIYCDTPYTDKLAEEIQQAIKSMEEGSQLMIGMEGEAAQVDVEFPEFDLPVKPD